MSRSIYILETLYLKYRNNKFVSGLIFILPIILLITHEYLFRNNFHDDVFISLTFAKNLGQGFGFVHNQGLRVEGFSSFLWIILLAPLQTLKLDLLITARIFGCIVSIFTLLMTAILSKEILGRENKIAIMAVMLIISLNSSFAFWGISGMETPLFSLLFVSAVLLLIIEIRKESKFIFSGFLFFLLCITRPEGIIIGLATLCWLLIVRFIHKSDLTNKWLINWALTFIIPCLIFFLARYLYFGHWFPTPVYAKSNAPLFRQVLWGLQYLFGYANFSGSLLLLIALCVSFFYTRFSSMKGLIVFLTLFYVAFIIGSGGDWMQFYRFFAVLVPFLAILLVSLLADIAEQFLKNKIKLGYSLVLTIIISLLVLSLLTTFDSIYVHPKLELSGKSPIINEVNFIKKYGKPSDVVAVVDAGAIGYYTDLYILDMVGLLDEHIAHLKSNYSVDFVPTYNLGFGKWDVEYVLSKDPAFIQMHLLGDVLTLKNGEYKTDWLGTDLLLDNPKFKQHYVLKNIDQFPIFVRRDIVVERSID